MNHCLLRAQVTMMQHTVSVFCAANAKFQHILIIGGCVDSVKHKFYILVVGVYTHCNPATPTGMHHYGCRRAKVENPIFKLWNSALKLAYISEIFAKRNLFWTFSFEPSLFLMLTQSFFTWTHTTDIISPIEFNNIFFWFLYLIFSILVGRGC